MISTQAFLKYLLFMNLGIPAEDYQTQHCFVMKSSSNFSLGNRVCSSPVPGDREIDDVLSFMHPEPFRWFVAESDTSTVRALEEKGMNFVGKQPAMIIDLSQVREISYPDDVEIRQISANSDVKIWISIVAECAETDELKMAKCIHYILKRAKPRTVKMYLAYYRGKPVGTAMTIAHRDVVSEHWICVLAPYRKKGIGSAITHKPLLDARKAGCKQSILIASELGRRVYKKLGYREYAYYNVFANA